MRPIVYSKNNRLQNSVRGILHLWLILESIVLWIRILVHSTTCAVTNLAIPRDQLSIPKTTNSRIQLEAFYLYGWFWNWLCYGLEFLLTELLALSLTCWSFVVARVAVVSASCCSHSRCYLIDQFLSLARQSSLTIVLEEKSLGYKWACKYSQKHLIWWCVYIYALSNFTEAYIQQGRYLCSRWSGIPTCYG